MDHKQQLEQLGYEKQKLLTALNEIEGAMKYAIQCLKSEAEPESGQPSDTKASSQESKTKASKLKA